MQTAIHLLAIGSRYATPVWLLLTALATLAFAALAIPNRRQRRAARSARSERGRHRNIQLVAQVAELRRYADDLAGAAEEAARTALRLNADWEAAHRTAEAVWRAYDRVESDARRTAAATAFPVPDDSPGPDDIAGRRRFLHRKAAEAYRRGALSNEQYADVLLCRGAWDPRLHPADLEALLLRAASERLLRSYLAAAAVERVARRDADIAAATGQSLVAEASLAMLHSVEAWNLLTAGAPDGASRPISGTLPTLALP